MYLNPIFCQSNRPDMDFRVTAMLQMQRKPTKLISKCWGRCAAQRLGGRSKWLSYISVESNVH